MTEAQWIQSLSCYDMLMHLAQAGLTDDDRLAAFADMAQADFMTRVYPATHRSQTRSFRDVIDAITGARMALSSSASERAAFWAAASAQDPHSAWQRRLMLRDLFGTPFPPFLPSSWAEEPWVLWRDSAVARMARQILDDGSFGSITGGMPILADALEEAGAPERIIDHCRGTVRHYNNGGVSFWYTDLSGAVLTPETARAYHLHTRHCWVLKALERACPPPVTYFPASTPGASTRPTASPGSARSPRGPLTLRGRTRRSTSGSTTPTMTTAEGEPSS